MFLTDIQLSNRIFEKYTSFENERYEGASLYIRFSDDAKNTTQSPMKQDANALLQVPLEIFIKFNSFGFCPSSRELQDFLRKKIFKEKF